MVTYHEWCQLLRTLLEQEQQAGKLGIVAAQSGVPEGRLQRWLEKDQSVHLSHTEFLALHETLSERVANAANGFNKTQTVPITSASTDSSADDGRTQQLLSFDSSD